MQISSHLKNFKISLIVLGTMKPVFSFLIRQIWIALALEFAVEPSNRRFVSFKDAKRHSVLFMKPATDKLKQR